MGANQISDKALRARWKGADKWLSDGGSRGSGRLVAKLSHSAPTFYFSYFDSKNRRRFYPIGHYDSTGTRGITLASARDRAAELSRLYRAGKRDLHEHFEAIEAEEARARRHAEDAARREEEARLRGSLKQLLDAYTEHLERSGKQSAGDVRRLFKSHVYDAMPVLCRERAADVRVDDFVELLGRLTAARKGRTAAKLRSYLRAAYALALRSKTDPDAPLTLRTFGIETNPLASIGALSKYTRARDRTLSAEELQAFMKRLETLPESVPKDALILCLLLGGQRPAQLLRVRPVDVDLSAETVTLYDPKGSRKQPRPHVLPLRKKPAAILEKLLEKSGDAPSVFTSDGKRPVRVETVSGLVTDISATMVKAKEAREGFQLRDLRRTCETMLAALKVSSDVRAQLQSHGLGGVQQRHYDRHSYMLEKQWALNKWERQLERIAAHGGGRVVRGQFRKGSAAD